MAVVGIGVDIVYIPRIGGLLSRYGQRFLNRIYTPCEIENFQALHEKNQVRSIQWLASRWAVKEAVYKACYPQKLSWKDISLRKAHPEYKKPTLNLQGNLLVTFQKLNVSSNCVSISHDFNYCIAYVCLSR
eukprot:Sdes_comp18551_c0_seq1m8635